MMVERASPIEALSAFASTRESRADRMLRLYDEQDARLVTKGFPPTSPWWRAQIERMYRSGKRRCCFRVGRRGGKSSTTTRVGVLEALHGEHQIPPGDVGVVAFVSIDRREAASRLRTVIAILDALDVSHRPTDGGIALRGLTVEFRVHTASIGGVSGFTAIFVVLDEMAKWRDRETGANPATEVLRSIKPTMRTQKHARMWLISSPFATVDAHYDAYEEGETTQQLVATAATWIANPTVTEQETRDDEKDERAWRREYAAIPQTELKTSLLSLAKLAPVTRAAPADLPPEPGHYYVGEIDPASKRNAWTLLIACMRRVVDTSGVERLVRTIVFAREWLPSDGADGIINSETTLTAIASICRGYGLEFLWTDQWASEPLQRLARQQGIALVEDPWGGGPKRCETFTAIHDLIVARQVELHPDLQLRSDLLAVQELITRAGKVIELRHVDGRHADYAACARVLTRHMREPSRQAAEIGTEAAVNEEEARAFEAAKRRFSPAKKTDWWKKSPFAR